MCKIREVWTLADHGVVAQMERTFGSIPKKRWRLLWEVGILVYSVIYHNFKPFIFKLHVNFDAYFNILPRFGATLNHSNGDFSFYSYNYCRKGQDSCWIKFLPTLYLQNFGWLWDDGPAGLQWIKHKYMVTRTPASWQKFLISLFYYKMGRYISECGAPQIGTPPNRV